MDNDYLQRCQQLMKQFDADIWDDYQHSELDLMMRTSDWKELKKILTVDERRVIRYYCCHRRGECSFHPNWLKGIESAIARINEYAWKRHNERLAVYDQINNRYWAGLDINISPWCPTKSRCLLFREEWRDYLEELCDRSNKTLGRRQFLVVTVDATKRLKFNRPE